MTPKTKTPAAVLDQVSTNGADPERERVFSAYRLRLRPHATFPLRGVAFSVNA